MWQLSGLMGFLPLRPLQCVALTANISSLQRASGFKKAFVDAAAPRESAASETANRREHCFASSPPSFPPSPVCSSPQALSLPALDEPLLAALVALARHSPAAACAVRDCPRLLPTLQSIFVGVPAPAVRSPLPGQAAQATAVKLLTVSACGQARCILQPALEPSGPTYVLGGYFGPKVGWPDYLRAVFEPNSSTLHTQIPKTLVCSGQWAKSLPSCKSLVQ